MPPAWSPSVYRFRCGSFAAPYSDSAIWKVVTSPSRLSYRPPGSVFDSRCGSLSLVLKADLPNSSTTEAVRYCQGRMAGSLVTQSSEKIGADEGSAVPVASKNRLAASTRKIALQHGHLNHLLIAERIRYQVSVSLVDNYALGVATVDVPTGEHRRSAQILAIGHTVSARPTGMGQPGHAHPVSHPEPDAAR